jgi:alanyl-tRNA synthetase
MLTKNELIKEFAKEPDKYYSVKLFQKEGFERKRCKGCGMHFWTADPSREMCGDSSHEPYDFLKKKASNVTYEEMWHKFSDFFKKNGHSIIDRYPVVSRWRPDLYFTIASIQDFQRIENGKMSFEYGNNPLVVPQICMRFNDIPNVGVTGRHFTSFMMAGQHAFNYPKEGYWRDRCMDLNYGFLTKQMGIKKEDLTYIEDVWAMGDFSEFGPSLEFFSKGLELGNNVFTQFEYSEGKKKELQGKVVDVGWGFERLLWYYTGAQTNYDAVFPKELEYIYKNSPFKRDFSLYSKVASLSGEIDITDAGSKDADKELMKKAGVKEKEYHNVIKPMQAAYAIADHTRTLLFAINDGALPSNMGGGYNLRIITRRIFDFIDRYSIDLDLIKLMEMHANDVKNLYKGMSESISIINEVMSIEKKRYASMREAATKHVTAMMEKNEEITPERMRTLYESNGITPEFISRIANEKGKTVELPEELYNKIIKGDFARKEKKENSEIKISLEGLPSTKRLYYDYIEQSDSKVLLCEGTFVILDKTPFYPEGGGQEADRGTINGIRIKSVESINGIVVHEMESHNAFKKGEKVECKVDVERRIRLMAHHTATHIINASARNVLGPHAWQEGAKKSPEKAHIDISHYDKLTEQQVSSIEDKANGIILHGIKVKVEEMERGKAEEEYGFTIYQGHGVPASKLRIVTIRDLSGNLIDAQACGGLHLMGRETMIGLIKIISTSRPHDGVDRIEFTAGPAALDKINKMEKTIKNIAGLSSLDVDKLDSGMKDRMEELQRARKENRKLAEELGKEIAEKHASSIFSTEMDYGRQTLRNIANAAIERNADIAVVLRNKNGEIVCISGHKSGKNALELVTESAAKLGKKFNGGGTQKMAEGTIS